MAEINKKSGKVVLDIELQDLLELVSKNNNNPAISNVEYEHTLEGEDLRKAWFKHVLINIEKLADSIHGLSLETVRKDDVVTLRAEFKEDLRVTKQELKEAVDKNEAKVDKIEDSFKQFNKDTIEPIKTKLTTIAAKLAVWVLIVGFAGSGIVSIVAYLLKEFVIKPHIPGVP